MTNTINKEARNLVLEGMYPEAIEKTDHVLQLDPNNKFGHIIKSYALYNQNRYEEALENCNKAIDIDMYLNIGWLNRAAIFAKMGRYEDGLKDCDRALELNPASKNALYNKGVIYEKIGRVDEAISCYDEVLSTDQNHPRAKERKESLQNKYFKKVKDEIDRLQNEEELIDTRKIERALQKEDFSEAQNLLKDLKEDYKKYKETIMELEKLDGRIASLSNRFADGEITEESFRDAKNGVENQKYELENKLGRLRKEVIYEDYQKPF